MVPADLGTDFTQTSKISPPHIPRPNLQLITCLQDYHLHDPALTDLGFGPQCDELAEHLKTQLSLAQEIELIVVSPMRRTLQTAQQSLGWLMERGVPVILRAGKHSPSHCFLPEPCFYSAWSRSRFEEPCLIQ